MQEVAEKVAHEVEEEEVVAEVVQEERGGREGSSM